jgi:hypothetical protein
MADAKKTREAWLVRGIGKLARVFKQADYIVPDNVRVSVGFPKGSRGGRKTIGQCWTDKVSGDKTYEIFISPELDDSVTVLDVLTHELIHAIVGTEAGHKGAFKQCALAVGLEGKMTATNAGEELKITLTKMAEQLGEYPHASLKPNAKHKGSRLKKAVCPKCGATFRIARKTFEEHTFACVHGKTVHKMRLED